MNTRDKLLYIGAQAGKYINYERIDFDESCEDLRFIFSEEEPLEITEYNLQFFQLIEVLEMNFMHDSKNNLLIIFE